MPSNIRHIWLVRHGESAANAGHATDNPADIPLTEEGHKQAKNVSLLFEKPPNLIITSPFLRTKQTAAQTIARFPNTPIEVWDIQEFTYLEPATCKGTTAAERRKRVLTFWEACDPEHIDGEGAESFSQMLDRVETFLKILEKRTGFVVVFGHGQFIQAARMLVNEIKPRNDKELMRRFREMELSSPIKNGEIVTLETGGLKQ